MKAKRKQMLFFKKESSVADMQDLSQIEMPEEQEEHSAEKGDEQQGERQPVGEQRPQLFTQQQA